MKDRILVVADNQPSRELRSDWLEVEESAVVAAANLGQAFAVFKRHPPHAVPLDTQLGPEECGKAR